MEISACSFVGDAQMQIGTYTPEIAYSGPNRSFTTTGKGTRTFWVRACKSSSNCSAWRGPLAL